MKMTGTKMFLALGLVMLSFLNLEASAANSKKPKPTHAFPLPCRLVQQKYVVLFGNPNCGKGTFSIHVYTLDSEGGVTSKELDDQCYGTEAEAQQVKDELIDIGLCMPSPR